jgi:vacuolar-type H+-ATPase subunit C/Vma6
MGQTHRLERIKRDCLIYGRVFYTIRVSRKGDTMAEAERSLAVLIDFENLALGLKTKKKKLDIQKILERLVEKGKIIVKKAYADWSTYET